MMKSLIVKLKIPRSHADNNHLERDLNDILFLRELIQNETLNYRLHREFSLGCLLHVLEFSVHQGMIIAQHIVDNSTDINNKDLTRLEEAMIKLIQSCSDDEGSETIRLIAETVATMIQKHPQHSFALLCTQFVRSGFLLQILLGNKKKFTQLQNGLLLAAQALGYSVRRTGECRNDRQQDVIHLQFCHCVYSDIPLKGVTFASCHKLFIDPSQSNLSRFELLFIIIKQFQPMYNRLSYEKRVSILLIAVDLFRHRNLMMVNQLSAQIVLQWIIGQCLAVPSFYDNVSLLLDRWIHVASLNQQTEEFLRHDQIKDFVMEKLEHQISQLDDDAYCEKWQMYIYLVRQDNMHQQRLTQLIRKLNKPRQLLLASKHLPFDTCVHILQDKSTHVRLDRNFIYMACLYHQNRILRACQDVNSLICVEILTASCLNEDCTMMDVSALGSYALMALLNADTLNTRLLPLIEEFLSQNKIKVVSSLVPYLPLITLYCELVEFDVSREKMIYLLLNAFYLNLKAIKKMELFKVINYNLVSVDAEKTVFNIILGLITRYAPGLLEMSMFENIVPDALVYANTERCLYLCYIKDIEQYFIYV